MEQRPTWETELFLASQEIPRIWLNPTVHYRVYKYPPTIPILSQINSVHFPHPTSWWSVLILPSHLRLCLPISLFPSNFPTKTLYTPLLPLTCFKPGPHSSRFYHPNSTWWAAQIIKLLTMYFYPLPCYLVSLRLKYSPQHPILKHPQTIFLPQRERQIL